MEHYSLGGIGHRTVHWSEFCSVLASCHESRVEKISMDAARQGREQHAILCLEHASFMTFVFSFNSCPRICFRGLTHDTILIRSETHWVY
eukprot:6465025-Amphidinium_carterae.2